jgi:multidrug efflux pump subunit AcrA (membrane-fusion protein)
MVKIKRKKLYIWLAAGTLILAGVLIFGGSKLIPSKYFVVHVTDFEKSIQTKGEIQGKNSLVITMPEALRNRELHMHDILIKDMVQEGTLVKEGDWVATLDQGRITSEIQTNAELMERQLAELNDQKVDTSVELSNMRESIREGHFDLEYKKLDMEQSKFESPAYQRKAELAYNRKLREVEQIRRNYERRRMRLKVWTARVEHDYNDLKDRDQMLNAALEATNIKAPTAGMIIYAREWGGRKIRKGDQVSPWRSVIATMPDLSELVSETYIQEIDVAKIKKGDTVQVTVDAVPNKEYLGLIDNIANIGQELSGFDSKVFKVIVEIVDMDNNLKPAMTTNNMIIIEQIPNVITIPRECIYSENGKPFVYMKHTGKIWKKWIATDLENETMVIVKTGLQEHDRILLNKPEETADIKFIDSGPEMAVR